MFKNTASQKIAVFAFDTTTGAAKTGDSANITVYVNKDWAGVVQLADTSATEIDNTNAKGWYLFDVAQGETNADALLFSGKSSTANISVVGQLIFTTPPNFSALSVDSSGRVDVIKVNGTSQTARDLGGQLDAAVSTRMATYTQPTGFLAATFPGTVASTTNITAASGVALSAAGVQAIWDALTSALTTVGSIGKLLVDNVNATISSRLASASYTAADNTSITAIKTQTDKLAFTVTNQVDVNVVDWKGATAPAMSGDAFSRLGAPAGASVSADIATIAAYVDTEVAAIKAKTDQITFSTANRVDSQVFGMENNTVTSAAIATDAIGSAELASTAITEIQAGLSTLDAADIRTAVGLASANLDMQLSTFSPPTANQNADALLDRASGVESGWTVREALRVILGVLAGPASGMGTFDVTLKNPGDSKNRVRATVDSVGNRSAITYDKT